MSFSIAWGDRRKHMKRLIEDLLDVARIENQSLSVQAQPETVATLLEDVHALATPLADAAKVRLQVSPPHDTEVRADRQRVVQVLSNLVGNALKFTPPGGLVSIEAAVETNEVLLLGGRQRHPASPPTICRASSIATSARTAAASDSVSSSPRPS